MQTRVPLACCFLLLPANLLWAQASAHEPDLSQEAVVFEHLNESVRFENDGSGVRETTAAVRIQSQAGVQAFGQLVFGYSTANEDLTVDYVRVRKPDGTVVNTPASTAQDFAPDVLREAPMYSDYRQRHISVVELQSGVTLEYHVITKIKPLAPGEFWYEFSFLKSLALLDGTLQINLPKDRVVKLKSPDRKYETRDEGDRRVYSWAVKNYVPDRSKNAIEEEEEDGEPDVQLSSFTDWQQIATWYAKLQSERAVPDQAVKAKADELTRGARSQEEMTRRLYDFVAQNIRYVSLSFGVGRFQPHAASEVLQNGYGDCKDKHTLLQAMLAAEGLTSYPVLIHHDRTLDPDVPSPAQFDHVITAAKLGGNFTWLDTTAEVAPYGLIAYPLRNQQAVIASLDSAGGLHRTPADSPVPSKMTLTINAKVSELGALDGDVQLIASGDNDWPLRATFREVPPANWARALEAISQVWGLPGDVSEIHIETIPDTAKPLRVAYHLHNTNYFKVPNSAANFQMLPPSSIGRVPKASKKHPGKPLDVGPAGEVVYRAHVEFPPNFTVHIPADVSVSRDYGQYSTSYTLSRNVLDAERRMVLKVNELPSIKRADYTSFHNVTTSAVEETPWCSIARPSAVSLASAAQMKGSPAELRDAGEAALRRQDFATAAAVLQRAADQEPDAKEIWDRLGQAYSGLNQHEKAAQAFQKQLEKDPYHPHANAELAAELVQLGRSDDAIAAYKKQIEIAPSEKLAHKQLGLLLVQLKRDQEARSELEAAAAIPPDDPEVKMALAQLYSRTGDSKKSELMMASLTGGATTTVGNDFFGPALRDDVDPVQAAHDAEKNLSDIGDQFESGEHDRLDADSFSAMDLVALSWARLGWARFLQGQTIVASQFLDAAWHLSFSGTVANRLARVYEKTGARDRAAHMYALAAAAGGPQSQNSREQAKKLNPANAAKELTDAAAELEKMQTIALPRLVESSASARFALLFDNSDTPDRVQFLDGDESLRSAADKLQTMEFPVKFPDVSSIKIIRLASVTCSASSCSLALTPLHSMQAALKAAEAQSPNPPTPAADHPQLTNISAAAEKSESQSDTPETVSFGGPGTSPPRVTYAPDPAYTDAARRARVEGVVLVQCVVGEDGKVRDARILTSLRPDLDASALDAVRQWQFQPAIKDGKPVAIKINVNVKFQLDHSPGE